ncbi:MAG: hypothetical protein KatS3mg088_640 [Patescibacteria group bacterium]|nr:MAG: hypothetical protein KatS3mg088_640 [Patescibacteria group bacterium]
MRKEIIFALLAGITFGLVIAFGIWKTNSNQNSSQEEMQKASSSANPNPQTPTAGALTILKPEENEVIGSNSTTIEGVTEPESKIVISNENQDLLIKSDKDGGFSVNIPLISGLNEIIVTSFLKDNKTETVKLPIVYSEGFQK